MIQVYLAEWEIDGERYAEHICARSWEEAERRAKASGASLKGLLYAQIPAVTGYQVFEFIRDRQNKSIVWTDADVEQLEAFICNPRSIEPEKL